MPNAGADSPMAVNILAPSSSSWIDFAICCVRILRISGDVAAIGAQLDPLLEKRIPQLKTIESDQPLFAADLAQLDRIANVIAGAVFFVGKGGFQSHRQSYEYPRHREFDHRRRQGPSDHDQKSRQIEKNPKSEPERIASETTVKPTITPTMVAKSNI
jgi:hypothetical protein